MNCHAENSILIQSLINYVPRMDIPQLINDVQLNCHISDARHAGNYTLCVYLLKMREFYRWEHRHAFSEKLSTDDIGDWLSSRENLWQDIENDDYHPIDIADKRHDPFDSKSINQSLVGDNLIYSGGYGVKDSESFKRMIWERTDEWRWNKPENAMARAIRCYDFDNDLENALSEMTDNELDAAILHEIGEIQAGENLAGWHQMMSDITFTQAEIMARAVRDHYADALNTLPALIENDNQASIHFYFANLTNMRKHIFPSLMDAYDQWCENKNVNVIEQIVASSLEHWQNIAQQIITLHQQDAQLCSDHIEALVKQKKL